MEIFSTQNIKICMYGDGVNNPSYEIIGRNSNERIQVGHNELKILISALKPMLKQHKLRNRK